MLDEIILKNKSRMLALFPELAGFTCEDYARIGTDRPVIMIAMTARTGSTFLMGGLSQAFNLGNPADMTEIFNCRHVLPWYKENVNIGSFGEFLQNYYSQSGSHIIFKTNWLDFAFFKDHIGALFPNLKLIYLDRVSIEAQAVSAVKAMESNLWHTADDQDVQNQHDKAKEVGFKFNLPKICRAIESIAAEKACWEMYFFDTGKDPVRLIYEGFSEDLQIGIDRITKAIGIDASRLPPVRPYFKKLSDGLNDDWVQRVKKYRNGGFYKRTMAEKRKKAAGRGFQGRIAGL